MKLFSGKANNINTPYFPKLELVRHTKQLINLILPNLTNSK